MVDILALLHALPVLELAPNVVATIDGFLVPRDTRGIDAHAETCTEYVNATIDLLEPPAGQYVPYIDPVAAMVVILGSEGKDRKDAVQQAGSSLSELKTFSRASRWVCFFNDYEPDSPECLPVLDFIAWLRQKEGASNAIVDFVARVAEIAPDLTIFTGPDNASDPWALTDLPALPQPKEMIEFVPGAPWYDDEWGKRETWGIDGNPFVRWRESIRPIAVSLSAALGESVYHFADWRCDTDDDLIHRFLVLHWCCSYKPNSTYVQYLVKVSGATSVTALMEALVDPSSYSLPFLMNDRFIGIQAASCRFDYDGQVVSKTVGLLFWSEAGRHTALNVLAQHLNASVRVIAPKALVTSAWQYDVARYCRSIEIIDLDIEKGVRNPIEALSRVDRLFVMASEVSSRPGEEEIPAALALFMSMASTFQIAGSYRYRNGTRRSLSDLVREDEAVAADIAIGRAQRVSFTEQLREVRLGNTSGGTGLLDANGESLGYDQLSLPFTLIRRIAIWQSDFEEKMRCPTLDTDVWRRRHRDQQLDLAKALLESLAPQQTVRLGRDANWQTLEDIYMAI